MQLKCNSSRKILCANCTSLPRQPAPPQTFDDMSSDLLKKEQEYRELNERLESRARQLLAEVNDVLVSTFRNSSSGT